MEKNNSYNIAYTPGTSEVYNNEYNNYLISKDFITNTYYNNYGNTNITTAQTNISNFTTVKSLSKKNKNIRSYNINYYAYYINISDLLNPLTNANYYKDNITDFYIGLNTTNVESILNLVSSTTNTINNINLNDKYSYLLLYNNISITNYNYNCAPNANDLSHFSYYNISNNIISKNNFVLNSNNIYSVNAPPIKYKKESFENVIEDNLKGLNKFKIPYKYYF